MTLPASGTSISLSQVNTELGLSATATISMNDTGVRNLFGVAGSGVAIGMSNGFGKANAWAGTISSHQANLNLRTWALANGWNGASSATVTIASGIYIYSTSTGNAGLTIDGSWPGGLTVINNGYIMGQGGAGGAGQSNLATATAGSAGGNAISLGTSCTITNNSYIAGGGGGGGSCRAQNSGGGGNGGGGGGAGGGAGGLCYMSNYAVYGSYAGGAGGGIGASGANGLNSGQTYGGRSGAGGGRILPGSGGVGGTTSAAATGGGSGGGGGNATAFGMAPSPHPLYSAGAGGG
jgi:hypothetical protein